MTYGTHYYVGQDSSNGGPPHTPFRWVWADATARTAETDVLPEDVTNSTVGLQESDRSFWRATDDSPITWQQIGGAGAGDVAGPSSATDNAIVRFDGTTGKLIQNSPDTIADDGAMTITKTDAGTNDVQAAVVIGRNSSGTAAANFGVGVEFKAETNTTADTLIAHLEILWTTITHASRTAALKLFLYVLGSKSQVMHIEGGDEVPSSPNAHGAAAVDFQGLRGAATQVASGRAAVVAGGEYGTASGDNSTVSGGELGKAIGRHSTIPGGRYVTTRLIGEYGFGSGRITADKDMLSTLVHAYANTGSNTPTEMFLEGPGGSARITLENDSTYGFVAFIVARRVDADDESAFYKLEGCIDRNSGAATTALVGSVTKTVIAEDTAAWDVAATADTTNGSLKLEVTGENTKTIYWMAAVRLYKLTG